MASQRETRTSQVNGRVITSLLPTDGQLAVLAQHVRVGKKKNAEAGVQFAAIGTIMTVLENLVPDPEDNEFLGDLLVAGELDIPELIKVILGGEDTIDGEVTSAATATVVKRPTKRTNS